MEQTITIKEVIEKKGTKGLFKIITPESGNKMYAFDAVTFPSLVPGATLKVEVEQSGQYAHIKGVGVAVASPPPATTPPVQPPQAVKLPIPPTTEFDPEKMTKAEWTEKDKQTRGLKVYEETAGWVREKIIPVDSRLGLYCQSYAISSFEAVILPADKALIEQKIAAVKEAAKPKKDVK